jgi:hypothetical protein
MKIKLMMVFMACLFLSYTFPNYPNIVVYYNITDKQTKKPIVGAECTIRITYETKKCLPFPVKPFAEYSDTMIFKTIYKPIAYSLGNTPKKYDFEVQHKDYNTVIKRDSFDKCQFSLGFDIELERKIN